MADYNTILYEVERGRARITLNRPEKLNALSFELQTELNQALWDADNDTEVHVVILRGAGRAFSAGYDLTPLAGGRAGRDETYTKVYRGGSTFDDDAWQLERGQRLRMESCWRPRVGTGSLSWRSCSARHRWASARVGSGFPAASNGTSSRAATSTAACATISPWRKSELRPKTTTGFPWDSRIMNSWRLGRTSVTWT